MNLFDELSPLRNKWSPFLGNWVNTFTIDDLELLTSITQKVNKSKPYYPAFKSVFRIYKSLEIEDINVVIVGQDPYHNGNANGYAFGCKLEISPSLNQIIKAMKTDLQITGNISFDHSLAYLVKQGVFLINSSLTVAPGIAGSHEHFG